MWNDDVDHLLGDCMATFGEQIVFMPAKSVPVAVTAVFNEHATHTKYDSGDEIVEVIPTLGAQASQFASGIPGKNDRFSIQGRLWRVVDAIPDGHGHLDIRLMFTNNAQSDLPLRPAIPPAVTL